MINLNWTVDANGQISATWNLCDAAESRPRSLALMEAPQVSPARSAAANSGVFARIMMMLTAALALWTPAR